MFEPHEILDHHYNRFLEPTSTIAGVKAAVAGWLMSLGSALLVWLAAGAGLIAFEHLGTFNDPKIQGKRDKMFPSASRPRKSSPTPALLFRLTS